MAHSLGGCARLAVPLQTQPTALDDGLAAHDGRPGEALFEKRKWPCRMGGGGAGAAGFRGAGAGELAPEGGSG
jgi:hypothetical protein